MKKFIKYTVTLLLILIFIKPLFAQNIWDLRKTAKDFKASSEEKDYTAGAAFDGDMDTRWSSEFSDNQWIFLDLGEERIITGVKLLWESAYAARYKLEISADAKEWSGIKNVSGSKGGEEEFKFNDISARYIRLFSLERATQWGVSLYEFEVYGPMDGEEPKYGGLVGPVKKSTIYDYNIGALYEYFEKQTAGDPKDSKNLSDDEFLNLIEKRAFDYFWYEVSPNTLFVADSTPWKTHTSVAGIGLQLGAYVVGHYRGYKPKDEIYERVEKLLDNCWDGSDDPNDLCIEHHEGWTYHWVNIETGKWEGQEHVCTHDSIMYLCGIILAKHYFKGTKAGGIASKMIDSVDWKWIIHDGFNQRLISNAYAYTYDPLCGGEVMFYDGMKLDYILPIGGEKSSVPPAYWHNYAQTFPWEFYKGGFWRIERPAIWIHQWDNLWFDFKYMRDDYADYYHNSVEATLANRQWCIDNNSYDENLWGVGPSYGPTDNGGFCYKSYGAPPDNLPFQKGLDNDGTVTPNAALGSIIFTPEESIKVARYIYDNYKDKVWKRYGFTDSLNPERGWFSDQYISIDQGAIVLAIENYRSGLIWEYFSKEKMVWEGLERSGFKGVIDNFDESEHSPAYSSWEDKDNGKYYKYYKDDKYVKEGRYSLKAEYNLPEKSGDKYFYVKPSLNDFSRYKYISFWIKGSEKLSLSLTAGKDVIPLTLEKEYKSKLSWHKCYYKLPDVYPDEKISEIRFAVTNGKKGYFYLDAVLLTYSAKAPEDKFLIDGFEEDENLTAGWVAGHTYDMETSADKPHDGKRSLRIVCNENKKEIKSYIKTEPYFSDWRKFHSVSMRVYGKAEVILKLKDSQRRTFPVGETQKTKSSGWNHLFFNIQANLNPENCWEPRYDKQNIKEMQFLIVPEKTGSKNPIYIDSIMLTE